MREEASEPFVLVLVWEKRSESPISSSCECLRGTTRRVLQSCPPPSSLESALSRNRKQWEKGRKLREERRRLVGLERYLPLS